MKRKGEAGNVLILTALALTVLMGFMGLAVDMGMLRFEKRQQQTAADAAAIAGATDIVYGSVQNGALAASQHDGFQDNTGGGTCGAPPTDLAVGKVTVTVCNAPITGPHTGDANFVEVYVSASHPTYFMKILGIQRETVTARAVATDVGGSSAGCLYTLGPSGASNSGLTITGGGNGSITAPTCGIVDNGDFTSGNSAKWFATSGSFAVAGTNAGGKGNVTCSSGQSPCPTYNVPAAGNPLGYLTPPAVGTPKTWANGDGPGTYKGMSFGNGNSKVNLPAGEYVLDGGNFTCKGNETITGTGVMFYLTNGAAWDCAGTPSVDLTAPIAPAPYAGILIYQDPSDHASNTLSGTTTTGGYGGLVVLWGLTMKGTDTLTLEGTAGYGASAIKNAILVE